jgi:LacI family transcriptional regulator, gluconate utilization system Gnt-I transcriptional repressor
MSRVPVKDTRARLVDVARIAGVSPITASRAVRDPGKVSPATRERVAAAVAEVGYVPDLVAGSLTQRRTRLIGVVIPTITSSIYASTVDGLSQVLSENRFRALLGHSGYSIEEEERVVASFVGWRAGGIILSSVCHSPRVRQMLADSKIPVVETGNLTNTPIDMVAGFSNFDAAATMMRYLVERGYRKIGFIGARTSGNPQAADRQRAYWQSLRERGLASDPSLALECAPDIQAAGEGLSLLLSRHPDMDALFAAGEVWAIGAMLECAKRGWSVPARIAIAGFNDESIGAHLTPALTTIRVPRREIGRRAALMLLQRIQGQEVAAASVDLGFELVVRASA